MSSAACDDDFLPPRDTSPHRTARDRVRCKGGHGDSIHTDTSTANYNYYNDHYNYNCNYNYNYSQNIPCKPQP